MACRAILKVLKGDKSKRILLVVQLMELISKNSNLLFHQYISTKEFTKVFEKLLERKRGKRFAANFYTKD